MRKTLITAISLALLALGLVAPPPALAAASTYVVQGHPISAVTGMYEESYLCYTGAPAAQPSRLERAGGSVGSGALGWQMSPAGSVVGPAAILAGDPATLNTFRVDVLAPTGTTGWVLAYFEDGPTAYYMGWAEITIPASGSWQPRDFSTLVYDWDAYYNGVYDDTYEGIGLQSWAEGRGVSEAHLSVLLGCGGESFYLDGLTVANAANSSTYDFEAKPVPCPDGSFASPCPAPPCHPGHVTPDCPPVDHKHHMAHLEWSTTGKDVQVGNAVTIRYGESVWMLGHAHVHSDLNGDSWYSGVGTLTAQLQAGSSVTTESGAFGPSQYAAVKETPERTTIYRFTAAAQDGFPAVTSKEVTVYVQAKVRARVLDKHLVQGQKLAVKGKITPGTKRVKVTLQRRAGGRWTSLTASRTSAGGKFSLTTSARTPGKWKLRVKVNTTSSNVGTVTRSATVKVDRYVPPKPRPQQPPPPPSVDPTPEVTAPVDTTEPTKLTASAPTPPDRPTPTGRISAGGSTRSVAGTAAPRASRG